MPAPVSIAIGLRPAGDAARRPDRMRVELGAAAADLWFAQAGLACCAVEVNAALARLPASDWAGDPVVSVLVVAGTVTDKMAPGVLALYDTLPEPRRVLSFGSCANSGGPYWDSYCVTKGVDQLIPVDLFVPGCPPRPEALLDALRELADGLQ